MRIRSHIDSDPVVHEDGQAVFTRRGVLAEFENMRRSQAVAFPHQRVVEPHHRFPMAALQKERNTPPRPIGRDFDVTLIPCRSHIMPLGLEPKRNFDVTGLAIFRIPLLQMPRTIEDAAYPLCLFRDGFAKALFLQRTRQADPPCKIVPPPCVADAAIARIKGKPPLTR